jgi:hypothetical protein
MEGKGGEGLVPVLSARRTCHKAPTQPLHHPLSLHNWSPFPTKPTCTHTTSAAIQAVSHLN